jgi:serine/threonine-protein kinase RsbW
LSSSSDAGLSSGGTTPTPGTVTLTIPCSPEFVGTARLTILGVAGRMGFSYDQVEDIRLAVGEACANAIERSNRRRGGPPADGQVPEHSIIIRSSVDSGRLIVEVEDDVPSGTGAAGAAAAALGGGGDDVNPIELGALLMEILVDEVSVEPATEGSGTRVRLVKYAAGDS